MAACPKCGSAKAIEATVVDMDANVLDGGTWCERCGYVPRGEE